MFYHRPIFGVLDSCTSALSMTLEEELYEKAKRLGITLLTVAYRSSLHKFHDKKIEFDGQGCFSVSRIEH